MMMLESITVWLLLVRINRKNYRLTDDGTVFTWGVGADGQLGLGTLKTLYFLKKCNPF
jgi:hypothetical protein